MSRMVSPGKSIYVNEQACGHQASDEIIPAAPAVPVPSSGDFVIEQERTEKHPLLILTGLAPGDVVSLRLAGTLDHVGTVEARTIDGLIIWIRDDLNERRLFHFRDCQSVRLMR